MILLRSLYRKNIRSVIGIFLCSFFCTSQFVYSIHQLSHLNEIFCDAKEKHYHNNENDDFCKHLAFSSIGIIKIFNSEPYLNSSVLKLFYPCSDYKYSVYFSSFSRAPPFFLVIINSTFQFNNVLLIQTLLFKFCLN